MFDVDDISLRVRNMELELDNNRN